MRQLRLPILLSAAAIAVTACVPVTPMPGQSPVATVPPPVTTPVKPTVLDAASLGVARTAINTEIGSRMPSSIASAATDCVVRNATTAELIDIAQMTNAGVGGTSDSVAAIVKRPATTQCIAGAAAAARPATAGLS